MLKVLQIGQLPIELGGNYTTGIARVVGELSRCKFGDDDVFLYGTNIPEKRVCRSLKTTTHYRGFIKRPFRIIYRIMSHPKSTFKEWKSYRIGGNNPLRMEFYKDNFIRIIKEIKPDIIHYHGGGLDALYNANKKFHIPIVYTLHGLMWDGTDSQEPENLKFKRRLEYYLPMADVYTTLNNKALSKMLALGIKREKITIVPNGVDSNKFYFSKEERKKIRTEFNIKDSTIVFITTGLVVGRKGQFSFLRILETLGIDYQYWIVGNGPDFSLIEEYVASHNLENKVKLLGYVHDTEIYKFHSAADVYAHASTIEGQALSEIEAYSTGLKIIVRKEICDTVIGDPVNETDTYYIADFDNIKKDNIVSWLRKECSERLTRPKFDWGIIAEKYAKVYDEAIRYIEQNR